MRPWLSPLLVFVLFSGVSAVRADEKDEKKEKLEALKKKALENWKKVEGGDEVVADTDHFLIVAPKALEGKLKEYGALLEKSFELATKAVFLPKDVPVKGTITVYMLAQPEQLEAFLRRVEKRRPLRQENGSFAARDETLHVVAVQREKSDPLIEVQAAQQVAALLLQRKAGPATIVPSWLQNGFGRATYYRINSNDRGVISERGATRNLILRKKNRNAQDIWNGVLEGDEGVYMEPSLADFLAYGPARMKFPALADAFKPGENQDSRTMEQAMQAVELKTDVINKKYREWIIRPN